VLCGFVTLNTVQRVEEHRETYVRLTACHADDMWSYISRETYLPSTYVRLIDENSQKSTLQHAATHCNKLQVEKGICPLLMYDLCTTYGMPYRCLTDDIEKGMCPVLAHTDNCLLYVCMLSHVIKGLIHDLGYDI